MKKISLLITSVSLMLCSNHVLAQQVCQDDPRLYTIKKVISLKVLDISLIPRM